MWNDLAILSAASDAKTDMPLVNKRTIYASTKHARHNVRGVFAAILTVAYS